MTKPATIRFDSNVPLAALPDFPESEISWGNRASNNHLWIDEKATGFAAGIWEAEANLGRWVHWPTHELVLIIEGEVVMVEEDRETLFRAGECFFIPKGRRCIWNQPGYIKKFMVTFDDPSGLPDEVAQPIIKIDPHVDLAPSESLPAEMLHSAVPVQHAHEYFKDATGQFSVGVWQTTGYHRKLWNSPRHELMYIVEGAVTFGDDKGDTQIFKEGETFLVPLGAPTTWQSEGILRKIYCIFQPRTA